MISDAEPPVTIDTASAERDGPLRRCALSRVEAPKQGLIRFVAAPDGTVSPDIAETLPGRGMWLTCDRATVEEAVKRRLFIRVLKKAKEVPADLADRVERLLEKRALAALGLANKAGRLVAGFSRVDEAVASGNVRVLLHASDASADGARRLDRKLRAVMTELGLGFWAARPFTSEQLSLAIGRLNVVHAALDQGGATEHFRQRTQRLLRYRGAPAEDFAVDKGSSDGPCGT